MFANTLSFQYHNHGAVWSPVSQNVIIQTSVYKNGVFVFLCT